ncbi:MAG: hypothetical protein P8Y69_15685, partial [Gammaproteobacteria bacterium]
MTTVGCGLLQGTVRAFPNSRRSAGAGSGPSFKWFSQQPYDESGSQQQNDPAHGADHECPIEGRQRNRVATEYCPPLNKPVEAGERHQNVVAGKLQRVPERKRKPEPVHQPEPEAHQPAPLETVDPMDKIWIGGNGRGDSHILKFTRDGKFLAQYGKPGMEQDSNA